MNIFPCWFLVQHSHTCVDRLWALPLRALGSSHHIDTSHLSQHLGPRGHPQIHPQHERWELPQKHPRIQKGVIPDEFYNNTLFQFCVWRWEHQRCRNFTMLFRYSAEHGQVWNQYCDMRQNSKIERPPVWKEKSGLFYFYSVFQYDLHLRVAIKNPVAFLFDLKVSKKHPL